jgi:hypothetical protein
MTSLRWTAMTGKLSVGQRLLAAIAAVVRDVMLAAVEQRFDTTPASAPIEWLSGQESHVLEHRVGDLHPRKSSPFALFVRDVIAARDVAGKAASATPDAATGTNHHDETQETKTSGFTLGPGGSAGDAINNTIQQSQAAASSQDERAQGPLCARLPQSAMPAARPVRRRVAVIARFIRCQQQTGIPEHRRESKCRKHTRQHCKALLDQSVTEATTAAPPINSAISAQFSARKIYYYGPITSRAVFNLNAARAVSKYSCRIPKRPSRSRR